MGGFVHPFESKNELWQPRICFLRTSKETKVVQIPALTNPTDLDSSKGQGNLRVVELRVASWENLLCCAFSNVGQVTFFAGFSTEPIPWITK